MRAAKIFILLLAPLLSSAADFSSKTLPVPSSGQPGFTLTSLPFTNILHDVNIEKNRILENGSGVALGDVDGDGLCDIYLCALERPNALFKNLGGWKFAEIADAGGAACPGQSSTGAAFADLDNDGDLDLLVNGLAAGTRLFRNDGQGRLTEDLQAGFNRECAAVSLALADIEGDGDLDVFVVTYRSSTIRDGPPPGFQVLQQAGKLFAKPEDQYEFIYESGQPRLIEKADQDYLYLNEGAGRFTVASWTTGRFQDEDGKPLAAPPRHWGLAAMFRDLNNDLAPDLYICNDFLDSPDEIWMNDGAGNFRQIARLAIRHTSWSSMAVDVADINRDGLMDLFVADMLSPDNVRRQTQRANAELSSIRIRIGEIDNRPQNFQNTLQLNRGDGTFAEIANLAGLSATDWTWSAVFLDVDLDGWEDLLVTTGNSHDIQDADTSSRIAPMLQLPPHLRPKVLLQYPPLRTPLRAYRNNRDLSFKDASDAWAFNQTGIAHGMALGDLDNDGDLDIAINTLNAPASLYRNESAAPRLAVRLRGRGIGARIEVRGAGLAQAQEMIAGGRYASGDDPIRAFAALGSENQVSVRWRNGAISKIENIVPNQLLEFAEPPAPQHPPPAPANKQAPWFEDASHLLNHVHTEPPFDDWATQPLLPNRLSQFGPQVCAADFDSDSWPDLIIGAAAGQSPALFRNNQNGGFVPLPTFKTPGDTDGIVFAKNWLAITVSNYELPRAPQPAIKLLRPGQAPQDLSPQTATAGPLAFGELLFAGARFNPGRYPEPGASRLFRPIGDSFKLERELSASVADAGLVTGAQFIDLDNDNDLDLVLSCDWDSPKIFRNDGAKFTNATASFGLASFKGRWNCVLAADFNGDQRPDVLLGNWGRNTRNQRYLARPIRLYYGDFNTNNTIETIESFFDPALEKYVPWRGRLGIVRNVPGVDERFPTFLAFGSAGTEELLQGHPFQFLEAATLDTMLFLNRTNHFEPAPLPIEVQFAPAMALSAADFDGDGSLDVFLAQNFFALHDETTRLDAGRGLLLKGNGRGGFRAVPGPESGLLIYGEQRGSAAADFNRDGKPDLVITQNAGPARLYLNRSSFPPR